METLELTLVSGEEVSLHVALLSPGSSYAEGTVCYDDEAVVELYLPGGGADPDVSGFLGARVFVVDLSEKLYLVSNRPGEGLLVGVDDISRTRVHDWVVDYRARLAAPPARDRLSSLAS